MAVQMSQPYSALFVVFESGDFVSVAELGQRGEISWERGIDLAPPLSHCLGTPYREK